jgi:hypothetical protein
LANAINLDVVLDIDARCEHVITRMRETTTFVVKFAIANNHYQHGVLACIVTSPMFNNAVVTCEKFLNLSFSADIAPRTSSSKLSALTSCLSTCQKGKFFSDSGSSASRVAVITGLETSVCASDTFYSLSDQAGVTVFVVFRPIAYNDSGFVPFVFDWGHTADTGFGFVSEVNPSYTPTQHGGVNSQSQLIPDERTYVAAIRVKFGAAGTGYQSVTSQDGDVTV